MRGNKGRKMRRRGDKQEKRLRSSGKESEVWKMRRSDAKERKERKMGGRGVKKKRGMG